MLSEPVRICNDGARTGFDLLGDLELETGGLLGKVLQLWAAVLQTVPTRSASGLGSASSTLPMRRVASVLVGGS